MSGVAAGEGRPRAPAPSPSGHFARSPSPSPRGTQKRPQTSCISLGSKRWPASARPQRLPEATAPLAAFTRPASAGASLRPSLPCWTRGGCCLWHSHDMGGSRRSGRVLIFYGAESSLSLQRLGFLQPHWLVFHWTQPSSPAPLFNPGPRSLAIHCPTAPGFTLCGTGDLPMRVACLSVSLHSGGTPGEVERNGHFFP